MKITAAISFTPSLWPTLATLVLLPSLVLLGFWQLERAALKRALLNEFSERGASTEALPLADTARRYQQVTVSGHYDPERQFLLDAMPGSGGAGFHVLGLLQIDQPPGRIVVNRGWIPGGANRSNLPQPAVPGGLQQLQGRLDYLPRPGLELEGNSATVERWPALVLFPTMAELQRYIGEPLYPMVLLLDAEASGGFERDWSPVNFGPERHLAYAVQWFALAFALLVIFLVVNSHREQSHDN